MRKTFLLFVMFLASLGSAQSIAGLQIGQSKTSVESKFGAPDKVTPKTWVYDYGKLDIALQFSGDKISRIIASGDSDKRGIFKTRLGVVLGDNECKVVKAYGQGKLTVECAAIFVRQYSNIAFYFEGTPGCNSRVVRIEVFAPVKKHKSQL